MMEMLSVFWHLSIFIYFKFQCKNPIKPNLVSKQFIPLYISKGNSKTEIYHRQYIYQSRSKWNNMVRDLKIAICLG